VFYAATGGFPRLINLLADRSLLAAFSRGIRPVPHTLIERKAKRLEGLAPEPGSEGMQHG
jgi:hypothetical protein